MAIKVSSSGVRGQYHEITPVRAARFAQAFATYAGGGTVLLASDLRPSGRFLRQAVIAGLNACGCDVLDYGIMPTPVLQWLVRRYGYSGGVAITANHNTFDWNSLIFINREGAYLNHWEAEDFFNIYHSSRFDFQPHDRIGAHADCKEHIRDYFASLAMETAATGKRCVLDCANGFGQDIVGMLQEVLPVKLIPIFTGGEERPWKDPEPNRRNASLLATIVRETGSDGGFLFNSDASRLLLVDEKGEILSEELTFPIFASILLEKEKSDLVTNYSTSKVIDQVAGKFGVKVFRTDIGQPHVMQMAVEIKAAIAGEGNGSTAYAPFSFGFDSLYCLRTIVAHLVARDMAVSQLAAEWKTPSIVKEAIPLPPEKIYASLDRLEAQFPKKKKLKDGFYVEEAGQWLCVRASSTVSIIRLVGEGKEIRSEIGRLKELLA